MLVHEVDKFTSIDLGSDKYYGLSALEEEAIRAAKESTRRADVLRQVLGRLKNLDLSDYFLAWRRLLPKYRKVIFGGNLEQSEGSRLGTLDGSEGSPSSSRLHSSSLPLHSSSVLQHVCAKDPNVGKDQVTEEANKTPQDDWKLKTDERLFELLQAMQSGIQDCRRGVLNCERGVEEGRRVGEQCRDDVRVLCARLSAWESQHKSALRLGTEDELSHQEDVVAQEQEQEQELQTGEYSRSQLQKWRPSSADLVTVPREQEKMKMQQVTPSPIGAFDKSPFYRPGNSHQARVLNPRIPSLPSPPSHGPVCPIFQHGIQTDQNCAPFFNCKIAFVVAPWNYSATTGSLTPDDDIVIPLCKHCSETDPFFLMNCCRSGLYECIRPPPTHTT